MAAKKRKATKKKRKRRSSQGKRKSDRFTLAEIMGVDSESLDQMFRQMFPGGFVGAADSPAGEITPLEMVPDIMRSGDGLEGMDLAMEESATCPDLDMLLYRAASAPAASETLALYEEAVAAGERAIGEKSFREWTGHFWRFPETRSYMRAKQALAECLWTAGRHEQAVEHFQDMLRLNPNDNQGIRWPLASYLVDLDRDADLGRLLENFDDDGSAVWAYSRALLAFRASGDAPGSRKLLRRASKTNPHVPVFLLGEKELPREYPHFFQPAGESGAITYAIEGRSAWRNTAGALTWMRGVLDISPSETPPSRKPPWSLIRSNFMELPQDEEEVWQVDARRAKTTIDLDDETLKPWVFLVVNSADGSPLAVNIVPDRIPAAEVWEQLLDAMLAPELGEPRRPGKIQVRIKNRCKAWRTKLADIHVECELCEELELVDGMLETLTETIGGGLLVEDGPVDNAELVELPLIVEEAWQVDVRRLPVWVHEGAPHRPWSTLVVQGGTGMVLNQRLSSEEPTFEEIWNTIATTMLHPLPLPLPEPLFPHLPGSLLVANQELAADLASRLDDLDIGVTDSQPLDLLNQAFAELIRHLQDDSAPPSLVQAPGVKLEHVGRLYQFAAEFYRQAPWKRIPADTPLWVECEQLQSGPWVAFVMGQAGMTPGLAMCENPASIEALLEHDGKSMEDTSSISLLFGEQFEIHPEDLDAAEQYAWPIAAPEAYPMPIRINPGRSARPALAWEMNLLAGTTKAILQFVGTASDPRKPKTEYQVFDDLTLRLSWPT